MRKGCPENMNAVAEIPGRDDPKIDILQLVYQWLRDPRNGRWVMVLPTRVRAARPFRDVISIGPYTAWGSNLTAGPRSLRARIPAPHSGEDEKALEQALE
jgi:hypothetical protein